MVSSEEIKAEYFKVTGYSSLRKSQQIAYDSGYLERDSNFIVIAPTDAGKTGIAQMLMSKKLMAGLRIAYLVPIKALINEKRDAFQDCWGENYKVFPSSDRDVTFNNADIVVTTFETFYRNDLRRPDITSTFSLVVIDEFHILYDRLRGYNLEKVLTVIKLLNIQLICLSATFEIKEEVAEWLDAEIIFIPADARQVEINHNYIDLSAIPKPRQINAMYRSLEERELYPAIIFCTSRPYTKTRAEKFSTESTETITPIREIREKFAEIRGGTSFTENQSSLMSCMEKGVAFHHSQLRKEVKEYVEESFRNGKIKYLFSTTTLAYGVNFPAKTVVLYDLSFGSRTGSTDVPVHTYLQMAGRAGRSEFGDKGYAYVVAKDGTQLEAKVPKYLEAQLETAGTHIDEDDYFKKTILELIFSRKNKQNDILIFFEKTFFNYLSSKEEQLFTPFSLVDTIREKMVELVKDGFIFNAGASGFELLPLGEVTIDFLFKTFKQHELKSFFDLNRYLESKGEVEYDFNFLYEMYKMFPECTVGRIYRKRSDIIQNFYRTEYRIRNRNDIDKPEYSTYATYHGWMQNLDEVQIEDRFKVNPHPLAWSAREIRDLLIVYKELADSMRLDVPDEFTVFSDRLRYGVTKDELPFVKIRGLGRDSVRLVSIFCRTSPIFIQEYQGSLLNKLTQFYQDRGEEEFIDVLKNEIRGIGDYRIGKFVERVKEEL